MKVKLELFGASRDLSDKDFLEFNIEKKISINDFKKKIISYVDEKFKGGIGVMLDDVLAGFLTVMILGLIKGLGIPI